MTKQDIINMVAEKTGATKKTVAEIFEAVVEAITEGLQEGNNVTLTGFGTFSISKRSARMGVNPRNPSEKIKIPAQKLPHFKAGKSLKDAVR